MRAGPIEIFHNGTITRDSCIGTSYADAGRTDRDLSQWNYHTRLTACIGTSCASRLDNSHYKISIGPARIARPEAYYGRGLIGGDLDYCRHHLINQRRNLNLLLRLVYS
jgi:hypothetical protein